MSSGTPSGFAALPRSAPLAYVIDKVNDILRGRINPVVSLTLAANATTTTLTDQRITPNSFIGLMPTTSNAAAALGTTYISARIKGSATLTHANNAQTDRTFVCLIIN